MLHLEMLAEYKEAETIAEVEALTIENKADGSFDEELQAAHDAAVARLTVVDEPTKTEETTQPPVQEATSQEDELTRLRRQVDELMALVKQGATAKTTAALPRVARKWTLQSKDVSWSTKPQVHALMHIISANVAVGEEVSEDKIVAAVEANAIILRTKQPAKRIWDYYKGDHVDGLLAHGNLVKK